MARVNHRRSFRLCAAVFLSASMVVLTTGCPEEAEPCDPCPSVDGLWVVQTELVRGECDYLPMLLGGAVEIKQLPDETGSQAVSWIKDPISDREHPLFGDILEPRERDPSGTVATLSQSGQTVRLAAPSSTRLVTLRISLTGSFIETDDGLELSGSLRTTDISPASSSSDDVGATPAGCTVYLAFTAVR